MRKVSSSSLTTTTSNGSEKKLSWTRHYGWHAFLVIASCELAVTAIWSQNLVNYAAISFSAPTASGTYNFSAQYSLAWTFLALLPMIPLTIAGMYFVLPTLRSASDGGPGEENTTGHSTTTPMLGAAASRYAAVQRVKQERERTAAALTSFSDEIWMLWSSTNWPRVLLGTAFFYAAVLISRAFGQLSVITLVGWKTNAVPAVVSSLLCYLLMLITVRMFVDGVRLKIPGALTLAGTFLLDIQLFYACTAYSYAPNADFSSPLDASSNLVSSTTITLICSSIAAFSAVLFIGIQFSRMKLSRNALALTLTRLELNTASLEQRLHKSEWECEKWSELADQYEKQMEMINYATPAHIAEREYAIALAQSTNRMTAAHPIQIHFTANDAPIDSDADGQIASPTLAKLFVTNGAGKSVVTKPKHQSAGGGGIESSVETGIGGSGAADTGPDGQSILSHHNSSKDKRVILIQNDYENRAMNYLQKLESGMLQPRSASIVDLPGMSAGNNASASTVTTSTPPYHSSGSDVDLARLLPALLSHPVCIEMIKDELTRLHSIENVLFYLDARRFAKLRNGEFRRKIAHSMYRIYIADGGAQQINLSFDQVVTIRTTLNINPNLNLSDLMANSNSNSISGPIPSPDLFHAAVREVLKLMTTNLMKITSTPVFRICLQLLEAQKCKDATTATGAVNSDSRGSSSPVIASGTVFANSSTISTKYGDKVMTPVPPPKRLVAPLHTTGASAATTTGETTAERTEGGTMSRPRPTHSGSQPEAQAQAQAGVARNTSLVGSVNGNPTGHGNGNGNGNGHGNGNGNNSGFGTPVTNATRTQQRARRMSESTSGTLGEDSRHLTETDVETGDTVALVRHSSANDSRRGEK